VIPAPFQPSLRDESLRFRPVPRIAVGAVEVRAYGCAGRDVNIVDGCAGGDTRGPERYGRKDAEAFFDDGVEVEEVGGVVAGDC